MLPISYLFVVLVCSEQRAVAARIVLHDAIDWVIPPEVVGGSACGSGGGGDCGGSGGGGGGAAATKPPDGQRSPSYASVAGAGAGASAGSVASSAEASTAAAPLGSRVEPAGGLDASPSSPLRFVGGMDISFVKGDAENACATLVVLTFPELEVVYERTRMITLTLPYISGFLAFRWVWGKCAGPSLGSVLSCTPQTQGRMWTCAGMSLNSGFWNTYGVCVCVGGHGHIVR